MFCWVQGPLHGCVVLQPSLNMFAAGTKQVLPVSASKPDVRAEAGIPQKRGGTTGNRAEKDKASQRAADRAHNEAILAGASGGDQELALQLAVADAKVDINNICLLSLHYARILMNATSIVENKSGELWPPGLSVISWAALFDQNIAIPYHYQGYAGRLLLGYTRWHLVP